MEKSWASVFSGIQSRQAFDRKLLMEAVRGDRVVCGSRQRRAFTDAKLPHRDRKPSWDRLWTRPVKENGKKPKLLNAIFRDGLRGQRKWDMLLLLTTDP